jgi:N-methylhydantoinase A
MAPDTIIGVDIGGTFTDFVVYRPIQGNLETFKLLSTPDDPSEVVLRGIEQIHSSKETLTNQTLRVLGDPKGLDIRIIHGSTVATNALLERKGARTALVTTRGFGDLLQIGRQNRPELYDFLADPPPSLIPEELRFEVDERVGAQGEILHPLDMSEVEKIIPRLQSQGVESVAICLLFSFLRPEHELLIAGRLRETGMLVSPSCEILPEYREYERASTTAVNAYVSPALDHYLSRLEEELGKEIILRVMQSNETVEKPD